MEGMSLMSKSFHRDYVYSARDRWDEVTDKSRSLTTLKYKYIRNYMLAVPYDDHQAYIDFYRPAIHVMRKLNLEHKLPPAQNAFFARVKPPEELYDLETDPQELHNLAGLSAYAPVLKKLREELNREVSRDTCAITVQHPAPSKAPVILDWVKYYYPAAWSQMLQGKAIGYEKFARMYNHEYNHKPLHKKKP
jgi:uncharacterized sulfatase